MATPTLASLQAQVTSLQTALADQNIRLASLELKTAMVWRQPVLLGVWPVDGPSVSGSIAWVRHGTATPTSPVWFSIDGGPRTLAPAPIPWGPLKQGMHHIDLYLSAAGLPELSHDWFVTKA